MHEEYTNLTAHLYDLLPAPKEAKEQGISLI